MKIWKNRSNIKAEIYGIERWREWLIEQKVWQGPHGETEHHLHPPSSWMLPEHYLHWLVVFPQESTGKPENKPPSLSLFLHISLPRSLSLFPCSSCCHGDRGEPWQARAKYLHIKSLRSSSTRPPLPSATTNDTRARHICQVKSHWS